MVDGSQQTEVVVAGAGPAGLALVVALLERGIEVICVAPSLDPWRPRYGAWVDEVAELDVPLETVWQRAEVSFPRREPRILERPYAKIDSAALHRDWCTRIRDADAFVGGVVTSLLFSGDFCEIRLESGASIRARQFFDASGHATKFVNRAPMGGAWQVAFGADVANCDDTLSRDTMGLMLWDDGLIYEGSSTRLPAFYYTQPEINEISFREYTVLAGRPLASMDALEERFTADHVSHELKADSFERCVIPMGHEVPDLQQLVVGFGGAASMVHPATGYMVARVLGSAAAVVDAYLEVRTRPLAERSEALWRAIWPRQRVRTHELFRFGLEALLTMDVEETHAFFDAFFSLPIERWAPYQAGTATPAEVAEVMWAVFTRVGGGLRAKLARAGFGRHRGKLRRLLF